MDKEFLVFKGIDGASGKYLLSSMTPRHLTEIVRGEPRYLEHLKELKWWH